jgi:hypothetical protein
MAERGQVQSYRDLEVYQIAFAGAVKVHEMTMGLPKYELYEMGSQIRRSAKGIPANIAEGFGRWRYKSESLHFLTITAGWSGQPRFLGVQSTPDNLC